jgi:Arc/MetJ family transcription regulator
MRTTLDLPEDLLRQAMKIAHCKTKTMAILIALQNLIQRAKVRKIKEFRGKVKLDIDIDALRGR